MSIRRELESKIKQLEKGNPFSSREFVKLGYPRTSVDQTLSRLTKKGEIQRIRPGLYIKPQTSKYVGEVAPSLSEVLKLVSQKNGETIQIHGAEAARRLKLTTQMPTKPTYLTSGRSRSLKVGNVEVVLKHACSKKLQFAQKKEGLALSALWYLGQTGLSNEVIEKVKSQMSPEEFKNLQAAETPAWLHEALNATPPGTAHG